MGSELRDQLAGTLDALTDPALFFADACVVCGLSRSEHSALDALSAGLPARSLLVCALKVARAKQ